MTESFEEIYNQIKDKKLYITRDKYLTGEDILQLALRSPAHQRLQKLANELIDYIHTTDCKDYVFLSKVNYLIGYIQGLTSLSGGEE